MADSPKDVFTINEVYWLNEVLSGFNEWLVEHSENEDDEGAALKIHAASVTLVDGKGKLVGTLTKWSPDEDVNFEPNFAPDTVEVNP